MLILLFLFLPREVFWLLIVSFICGGASFLQDSVICLVRLPCLRSRAESSLQAGAWDELQQ